MRYQNTYIRIEQDLFDNLEESANAHNKHYDAEDENKINMDKAVFLLNYISLKRFQNKDNLVNGYVRLYSKFLNDYLKDELKKYRSFLKNNGYINTIPYNKDEGKSIGYKTVQLNKNKRKYKRKYISYEFLSHSYESYLNNQMEKNERIEKRKKTADRNTRHLTKWLNENHIQIDWVRAFEWIGKNKKLNDEQKFFYSYAVERMRFEVWQYSRSGKDNRLHSNLTNLPSDLRQFIKTNTPGLVSLDIKSSQPYILAGVLNLLVHNKGKAIKLMHKLKSSSVKKTYLSIMNLISFESLTMTDFKSYINLVCNSDIYNYVGENLKESFITSISCKSSKGNFRDKIYNSSSKKKETKYFKDLRAYCKTLTLEYMYCSVENELERIKQIKSIYPKAVNKFIQDFKYCKELEILKNKRTKKEKEKIKTSKKIFPQFLQQLESGIMLDTITKEISRKYPNMFMATIHDSIIIPKDYISKVKPYFEKRLFEIFGVKANIKTEFW